MAIRPPVQVRHKHAMASVAHMQLSQRVRKKRLGKIRRGTRKRDRSISSSDGEVEDEKGDKLSVTCSDGEFFSKRCRRRCRRQTVGNRARKSVFCKKA